MRSLNISWYKLGIAVVLTALSLINTGCATTAQAQFYRPINHNGEPFRIAGRLDPMSGWAGVVVITINDKEVITKSLPVFTNTTDASGTYEGKNVSATITRIQTFLSSYTRAEVYIGSERAATLTF